MQENFYSIMNEKYNNGTLPSFTIFQSGRGGGKTYALEQMCKFISGNIVRVGTKVDDVRAMIDSCYKVASETTYLIDNADNMSNEAKNALLKVTEEPPNKSRFIMTLNDINNTLSTIKSRGTVIKLPTFTAVEIHNYCTDTLKLSTSDADIISKLVTTPGEANSVAQYNATEFYEFVETVYDKLDRVSGTNSFKIGDKLDLKNDESKYSLELFFTAFMNVALNHLWDDMDMATKDIAITSKYKSQLSINGVNKSAVFDGWLLEERKMRFEL